MPSTRTPCRNATWPALGALAPVSGPSRLSAFEAAAADDKIAKSVIYLAYFVIAWNKMHGSTRHPATSSAPPATARAGRFDGHHTAEQFVSELPAASKGLFSEDFPDQIRKPDGVLTDKLRPMDNTCEAVDQPTMERAGRACFRPHADLVRGQCHT
ncbi:hypothetical protein [Streptomyces sp. D2-8]|uniref:hypothetical protein n=1 Tax=Streptomyces sp. D2-8 TaxID=2707767 RepID=UPI0020BE4F57|nr:hypothetical protein [Streptomyces sp. D2-8]